MGATRTDFSSSRIVRDACSRALSNSDYSVTAALRVRPNVWDLVLLNTQKVAVLVRYGRNLGEGDEQQLAVMSTQGTFKSLFLIRTVDPDQISKSLPARSIECIEGLAAELAKDDPVACP